VWLVLVFSPSTYLPTNGKISFFFMAKQIPLYVNTTFFNPFISMGHLGCFHSLVAINVGVQVPLL
jgi:hypothetical protein